MKIRRIKKRVIVGLALGAVAAAGVMGAAALAHADVSERAGQTEQAVQVEEAELVEGYLTPDEAPGAWSSDTTAFPEPLPEGHSWPEAPPSVLTTEGEVSEDGLSHVMAAYHWMCAWEGEVVAALAEGNEAAVAGGLTQLEKFTGLPGIVNNLQGADAWTQHVLSTARAGDHANLIEEFEGGTCAAYRESEASR
jgi:hypothetical protein